MIQDKLKELPDDLRSRALRIGSGALAWALEPSGKLLAAQVERPAY